MPVAMAGAMKPSGGMTSSRSTLGRMSAEERTRTALGPALQWYGMYTDRPEVLSSNAMAGLSSSDNRAEASGSAIWSDSATIHRYRWDEKHVKKRPDMPEPTQPGAARDGAALAKLKEQRDLAAKNTSPPSSPYLRTRPSLLSQRATLSERMNSPPRISPHSASARADFGLSGGAGFDVKEYTAEEWASLGRSRGYGPHAITRTQPGYPKPGTEYPRPACRPSSAASATASVAASAPVTLRAKADSGALWGWESPVAAVTGGADTNTLHTQPSKWKSPRAGILAAVTCRSQGESARLARVEELHVKLGIDKVVTTQPRVDATPQAGHHTAPNSRMHSVGYGLNAAGGGGGQGAESGRDRRWL